MEQISTEQNNDAKVATPDEKLVVGIQYKLAGKIYTYETDDEGLGHGDYVIVETEGGSSIGNVIVRPRKVSVNELPKDLKKVIRRASPEEVEEEVDRNEKALEHFEFFKRKVEEHNLPMKPIDAAFLEKDKKILFTFFAEERVDFRALVKELASHLHMRIEMRQIGARDEVKCMGGIGTCGLTTCCSTHLRKFRSITIQMVKTQGLMPNPIKHTGVCGKLKCCLAYENEHYAEIRKTLPRIGSMVDTPHGEGKIVNLDILKRMCLVRLFDNEEERDLSFPADQLNLRSDKPREPKKIAGEKPEENKQKENYKSRRR